jgi:outer membrane protein
VESLRSHKEYRKFPSKSDELPSKISESGIDSLMQRLVCSIVLVFVSIVPAWPQFASDSLLQVGTLQGCVRYALMHQPLVRESMVDEDIAERTIQSKLADWFPQLNLNFNVQHNPQLPVAIVQGAPINQGLTNSSNIQFTATQALFNRDVLLASSSASDVRAFARQRTASTKIDVVVNVSKAY